MSVAIPESYCLNTHNRTWDRPKFSKLDLNCNLLVTCILGMNKSGYGNIQASRHYILMNPDNVLWTFRESGVTNHLDHLRQVPKSDVSFTDCPLFQWVTSWNRKLAAIGSTQKEEWLINQNTKLNPTAWKSTFFSHSDLADSDIKSFVHLEWFISSPLRKGK